jgi:hypothetical protein
MSILLKIINYNDIELHLISWNNKPCFIVSELSNALTSISKDEIPVFLRYNEIPQKGVDYDVVEGSDSRDLRSALEDCGISKRFAKVMIIYNEGLQKYFAYKRTRQIKDFCSYLQSKDVFTEINSLNEEPTLLDISSDIPINQQSERSDNISFTNYSDFIKHISFMNEFVNSLNKLNISPDKSAEFTMDITKYLEENGAQPTIFLEKIKKWIV